MFTNQRLGVDTMNTLLTKIAAANYVASEKQVEQLAGAVTSGNTAGATFLRIVLALCLVELGGPRRGRKPHDIANILAGQDATLTAVNDKLYPHVLAGVGGEGVDKMEVHRRANFARSAVATIRAVIRGGVDIRTVDVAKATKTSLRKLVAPPEPTNRVERLATRSEASVLRALQRLRKDDPGKAEEFAERLAQEMQDVIEGKMDKPKKAKRKAATTRARAPRIVSHQLRRSTDHVPGVSAPH
jgi:hypothetical protein